MKAYERLNVEVVKFEAQDVITASVAAPCTCNPAEGADWCATNNHNGCQATEHVCGTQKIN